ncbi:MAG TPA: MFS transporter [Dehalococcoidales bacterium]
MPKRIHFPKIFFGWWTVLTGGILSLWAAGYYAYGFSALFKPIATELGFNRAATSIAASIGRLEGGIEGPLSGWITDRFGPRWIVLFGVFIIGLSLMLMYFVSSMWAFLVVWGVILGTGANIGTSVPVDAAISNWFVKKRGLALGTKMVFSGLSGVVVLPLIAWLITTHGWRVTCLVGGVVMLVIGLPLSWFFLKSHRPEYYGLLPDGATVKEDTTKTEHMIDRGVKYAAEVKEVEFTLRQAMRTPSYWLLIVANAVHSLAMPVMSIHAIPFLTDRGIDPIKAAGMMSIFVGVSIPFRFIGGFFVDRIKLERLRFIVAGAYLLQALGFVTFLLSPTMNMIYVWFVLYGIGMGVGFVMSPMRARYFGRKAFGSIQGTSMAFATPVGVIAPIYAGWVYDTTGSYTTAFVVVAGLLAAACVLMAFVVPPKPPAQITDVRNIV